MDYFASLRAARCRAGDHSLCSPARPQHGICAKCGKTIRVNRRSSARPEARVCHPCRRIAPVRRGATQEPVVLACPVCDRNFIRRTIEQTCSRRCGGMVAAWKKLRPGLPFDREEMAAICARRKTRALAKSRARNLRHAQSWDGIPDEEILDRDGWRCQVPGCKRRPIRRDLKSPHPRSKSIDHIIPLSLGGDDTAANKRAAHLGCNVARGNKMGAEQVALFGVIREPPLVTVTASGRTVQRTERWPSCPVFVKDCAHCGNLFTARQPSVRYCSSPCRRRAVGGVKACRCCGQQFNVILGGRKRLYCSDSCKTRAYQLRKAA